MYKMKQIRYNRKDKIIQSCTNEYLSQKKDYQEIQLYQITL